ncbi:MAG: winged helix-turn-helix transcriptional regulator [Spirochaetes bacterium]|nr:winged helix-turn-helix transcriptional regulator [Spirochaetota bacterium]
MNNPFQALSDPTRRRILEILGSGPKSAGELGAHFPMSGASVSHHLSVLREGGLVDRQKKGQQVIYTLNTTVFQEILLWIQKLKDGGST